MSDSVVPSVRIINFLSKNPFFENKISDLGQSIKVQKGWLLNDSQYQFSFNGSIINAGTAQGLDNAFQHAYASAEITLRYGISTAREFGDFREAKSVSERPNVWQTSRDNYADLHNNELGRRIGTYAKLNNLSLEDVKKLVIEAIERGETINRYDDHRIIDGFKGLPSGFDNSIANWSGPSINFAPAPRCFIAGTMITMADGTKKPIEAIDEDDMVLSFAPEADNGLGAAVPARVTRTFQNVTRVLLDVCGLRVTPGHEFLSDQGEWMNIATILRQDRAIVRDVDGRGAPFRARTNAALGSFGDAVFTTRFIDPRTGVSRLADVRGDIPFEKVVSPLEGVMAARNASLLEVLHVDQRISVAAFASDGSLQHPSGVPLGIIDWPQGTTPFSLEGAETYIVSLDGEPFTPAWIANIPRDGEETRAVMNAGGGPDDLLLLNPSGMVTMRIQDGKCAFNDPAPRQMLPSMRPMLASVSSGHGTPSTALNRAQRRRQSALRRVK